MSEKKDLIIQGLEQQREFIRIIRARQLGWANRTDLLDTAQLHLELAEMLWQVERQCDRVLENYQSSDVGNTP